MHTDARAHVNSGFAEPVVVKDRTIRTCTQAGTDRG